MFHRIRDWHISGGWLHAWGQLGYKKKRACMAQGKKFRTVNPVYRKIYRYRLCPRNGFRRNFEFFGFKIQKFKKIHKKRKPDFPT